MKLPDPLSRRHLLEGGLESAKALALARAYLEDGREIEAVDFLAAVGPDSNSEAYEALSQLQAAALERGDVFLMRAASAALDEEPSAETWRAMAEAASGAGRLRDAETAERLATVGAE
jgi:hypothetical protein